MNKVEGPRIIVPVRRKVDQLIDRTSYYCYTFFHESSQSLFIGLILLNGFSGDYHVAGFRMNHLTYSCYSKLAITGALG